MDYLTLAWLLPFLSGVCDALSRDAIKRSKIFNTALAGGGFLFALPLYGLWLYFEGVPAANLTFWIAIAVHVPLLTLAYIMTIEAHRDKNASMALTMPYLSFTPAFSLITSPLMESGMPTIFAGIGIVILTIGAYVLNIQNGSVGFLAPIKAFSKIKGSKLMLGVAIIFSVTANLDLIAVRNAEHNVPFYLLMDHGLVSIVMIGLTFFYYCTNRISKIDIGINKSSLRVFPMFGTLFAGSAVLHILAFKWISVVPYVISVKRGGSIVLAILLGIFMGFILKHKDYQERKNIQHRIPGALLMVIGMIVIILWGKN